jgi:lipid A 3-O-deacylase PagL
MFQNLLRYFLPAIIIGLIPSLLLGQNLQPWSGFGIETNAIAGKVFKHEPKFTLPIPVVTTGLDIDLLLNTYGKKAWEQRRNYPTIGLGFAYINYGIDSIYGRCFGMYPNIILPLWRAKNLEWTLRMGDGIGYVTKTFHRTAPVDTINVAIGSHINDFAMFLTDLRYHLNKHWDFQAGAGMTHISDASFHKPNLGINMVSGHIGFRYSPVNSKPAHTIRQLQPLKNRWLVQVRGSMSYVSSYTPGGPLYPIYIGSAYVSRRWWSKNKAFGGVDYSWHENIYAWLRNNNLVRGNEAQNSYKSALFAGNEFLIGRVGVVLQVGAYLKQAYIKTSPVYEKIGGNYYFVQKEHGPVKEFFLSAFVKTHETVAEFGEIGLGLGF